MHHGTESENPQHESEYYGGPSTPAEAPRTHRRDSSGSSPSGVEVRQLDRSAESSSPAGSPHPRVSAAPASKGHRGGSPVGHADREFDDVSPDDRSPPHRSVTPGEGDEDEQYSGRGSQRDQSLQMTSVRGDSAPPGQTPTPAKRKDDGGGGSAAPGESKKVPQHPVPAPPPGRQKSDSSAAPAPQPMERRGSYRQSDLDDGEDEGPAVDCTHGCNTPNDDSWRTKAPRSHGFHRPFHVLQIAAWSVTLLVLLMSFLTTTRAMDDYDSTEDGRQHTPMHIAFGLLCLIAIVMGVAASAIDPTDHTDGGDQSVFCGTCKRRVHKTSKHCKVCNRCALHFDHHCKWLNNCVGARNYFFFYSYVAALLLCIAFGVGSTIYFLVKYWSDANAAELTFAIIACVLYVLASLPLLHLCGFHVMLFCKGITTYQYLTGSY